MIRLIFRARQCAAERLRLLLDRSGKLIIADGLQILLNRPRVVGDGLRLALKRQGDFVAVRLGLDAKLFQPLELAGCRIGDGFDELFKRLAHRRRDVAVRANRLDGRRQTKRLEFRECLYRRIRADLAAKLSGQRAPDRPGGFGGAGQHLKRRTQPAGIAVGLDELLASKGNAEHGRDFAHRSRHPLRRNADAP